MTTKTDLFMVFDVESIGLHGEGFAVGWVVVHRAAGELEQGLLCCSPEHASGHPENRAWVREHVPHMEQTHFTPYDVRDAFWREWLKWKARGAVLVADCCWPVEARFLAACVDDAPQLREWDGPYPLHDLASVLLALGRDPLATNERRPDELPAHHPLADARQSARLLMEALAAATAAQPRKPARDDDWRVDAVEAELLGWLDDTNGNEREWARAIVGRIDGWAAEGGGPALPDPELRAAATNAIEAFQDVLDKIPLTDSTPMSVPTAANARDAMQVLRSALAAATAAQPDPLRAAAQKALEALTTQYPGGWANDVQKCVWDGVRREAAEALENLIAPAAGATGASNG